MVANCSSDGWRLRAMASNLIVTASRPNSFGMFWHMLATRMAEFHLVLVNCFVDSFNPQKLCIYINSKQWK